MRELYSDSLNNVNSDSQISLFSNSLSNIDMQTNSDFRRFWLNVAIQKFGTAAALADKANANAAYLSQIKKGLPDSKTGTPKEMGDDMARRIEKACAWDVGQMDKPPKESKDDWWPTDTNDPKGMLAAGVQLEKSARLLLKHQTQDEANVRMALIQPSVPVISFVAAGQMKDIGYVPDLYDLEDAETVTPRKKVGPRSWALEIDGYSMHDGSPNGWGPGYRIICDPDKGHKSGSYVIAKNVNDQSATFKQLIFEDDCWFLRPLNKDPIYKTIKIDDPSIRVIAVVTEIIPPSILL